MNETTLICKKLKKLKLPGLIETLEQRLKQAVEERWSYSTFLDTLLTDEVDKRDIKQLTTRLSKSLLDVTKTMETFDFSFNMRLPAALIGELSTCAFIEKRENIFLLGTSGTGKTHLAQALGHEACRRGWGVLSYRAHELFEWIHCGKGDGSHKRRLAYIVKIPLLILDDFGLQSLLTEQQEDLYEVIAQRYEKGSTIITSNRDFSEWSTVFASPLLASAALDRLIHKGTSIILEGSSYRLAAFQKRTGVKQKGG
jgi:DNA replication protein DnaC